MKMYIKTNKRAKERSTPIPNTIAYAAIKNFLVAKEFKEMRQEYCIGKLDHNQVNQTMADIKWLVRNFKGVEVLSIEQEDGQTTKFVL